MKFYYVTNILDLHTFCNGTAALLNFFGISTELHFVSLFFLNERNITSLLKNLSSSSINKSYLRTIEYAISFFFSISYLHYLRFLILMYVYFNEAFVKNFMGKLSFFNKNVYNSFQDVVNYRILGCQSL